MGKAAESTKTQTQSAQRHLRNPLILPEGLEKTSKRNWHLKDEQKVQQMEKEEKNREETAQS